MKYAVPFIAFLLFYSTSNAQLQYVDVEPHMLTAPNSEQPEGTTTYRIYANLLSPEDRVSAVFGGGCKPVDISTTTTFFNEENGGVTPANISVSAYELFPNLEADSWVTVGVENAADEGAAGIGALSASGTPFVDAFDTNPGVNLELTDGSWFSSDPLGSSGMGAENRVLIAQVTTDGELSFHLNISVFVGGDQQNGRIDYVWNQECEGSIYEQDGSELGLVFTGLYCADPMACNYSEFAEGENIDNTLCNYDACAGCTEPGFCNYSEYYTSDDGSCSDECEGCLDTEALNFDPNANVDDGSCLYLGCTNELATNYQDNAGQDDGSCLFEGCTDPEATNYFLLASEDDGSCTFICGSGEIVFYMSSTLGVGWLNGYYIVTDEEGDFVASGALGIADETDESNFGIDLVCLPPGTYFVELFEVLQDGVMTLEIGCAEEENVLVDGPGEPVEITIEAGTDCTLGCTDEAASNFDVEANFNFGCVYMGCTNELAVNYDPLATEDDGSCILAVSGFVFFDAETTGMYDENLDNGIPNHPVFIAQLNSTVFTDDDGYFELFDLPEGTYTLTVEPSAAYPVLSTSESFTVEVNGDGVPTLYFGLSAESASDDLELHNLSAEAGIPCNGLDVFSFSVQNTGATTLTGEVVLTYDDLYQGFEASVPAPISEELNVLTFTFTDLAPASSVVYSVSLVSPLAENSGEQVLNTILASAFVDEAVIASSEITLEETITCTEVSNDKSAAPIGYAEPHFILHETTIEYVIQFQNTSDAIAETVLIRDTLDVNLDLNTFEVVGQTHPAATTLDWNTREVTFEFENIQLPNATTDPLGSTGAVSYRIVPLAEAEAGTVIENTAAIYMDENEAFLTSNVFHTVYVCGEEANIEVENEVCVGDLLVAEATAEYLDYWNWTLDDAFLGDEAMVEIETSSNGEFMLELTAGNELCESTATAEISVFNLPNPQISQEGSELICNSGQAWQWFLNGEVIEGANEIVYTILEEGAYSVEIVNSNGCVGMSEEFLATPVNVLESEVLTSTFFPNPMTTSGTLQLSRSGQWELRVLDATGRVILQTQFTGSTWILQGNTLAPGLYFLHAQNEGEMTVIDVMVN